MELGGWSLWCLAWASHHMADFSAVVPAMEAPGSFTGWGLVAWLLGDVVLLVVMLGWVGGMKRLELSRSRRWLLTSSAAMVSSRDCSCLTVAFIDSWICLLTTAAIVFGGGSGVLFASRRVVALAEFLRLCLEATRRMLRAVALLEY